MIRYIVRCIPVLFFLGAMILAPPRAAADVSCGNNVPTQHCATITKNLSTGYVTYYQVTNDRTCLVSGKYTYNYESIRDSQFLYHPVTGGTIAINDGSGFPIAFSITSASPGYPGCPRDGISGPAGTLLEHDYQVFVYPQQSTLSPNADYASGTFGYINPKYIVTDVRYAPPGSKSSAVYLSSTTVGSTVGFSSTFSTSYMVSNSTTIPIDFFFDGQDTGSSSTTLTQQSMNASSTTITRTDTTNLTIPGPQSDYVGVDHDYDQIDVWINPVLLFSVYNTNVAGEVKVGFFGYGTSLRDQHAPVDIWTIQAGCLNGSPDFNPQMDSACTVPLKEFQRPWAAFPAENWPAGEGPALTSTDLANILATDPWGSCTRTSPQGSPACPTFSVQNGMYVLPGFSLSNQTGWQYTQPLPGDNPSFKGQQVSTTSAATSTSQNTVTYSQTWGWEEHFQGGSFLSDFIFDSKQAYTVTSSFTDTFMLTTANTATGTANMTGPACNGNPCNPSYPPSPNTLFGTAVDFDLFIDARYGTFVWMPSAY